MIQSSLRTHNCHNFYGRFRINFWDCCRFISNENSQPSSSTETEQKFNELFIMPKRKLRAQIQLERATGRTNKEPLARRDAANRFGIRSPRREDILPDQLWTDVWPSAASFKSSVVPLPVRMGTRRDPKRRPPFKTEGNLELLKVPNFLHLTPLHIEKHCQAIKKFCTPFPKELIRSPSLELKYIPLTIQYNDYVHQGTNIRDMRSRVVTFTFRLAAFNLDTHAHNKLLQLLGDRYDERTDTVTLVVDRCPTRRHNLDYAYYLITALYHESLKTEDWEKLMEKNIIKHLCIADK